MDVNYKKLIARSSFSYAYHKLVIDDDGTPVDFIILDANQAFENLTGLRCVNILNRKITEVLPELKSDSIDWIHTFGSAVLNDEDKVFDGYSEVLKKWLRVQVISIENYFFTTLFYDITQQKNSEVQLKQSEIKLRQYFSYAPDGIFIADSNAHYLEVNPAGCTMLGYTEKELTQLSVPDIVPPETKDEGVQSFSTLLETGADKREMELLKKNGEHLNVSISAVRLPDNRLMCFVKDIESRIKIEHEKELYYRLFQNIRQPMVITDKEGIILNLNDAFAKMYGYSKEEAVGKTTKILNPGKAVYQNLGYSEEEYHSLFRELWRDIKNPHKGVWENLIINRKKDGSLVWVRLMINAVRGRNNELHNFIALPFDVSGLMLMERDSKIQLFQTIADLAELRDNETGNHMRRVGIFAKMLAKAINRPEKYCDDIAIFAPMHDLGKVGILDSILLAPRKLTPEEFSEMKRHTILGYNIVKGKKDLEMVSAIALNHHERFDGKGYPYGLAADKIPLSARITSIADVYDALRSKRPYKNEWTHEEASKEIVANAGTQFDPELIDVFKKLGDQFNVAYEELRD